MNLQALSPLVAIACGGTGGHLFPGVAVAEALRRRGCTPHLFISEKEVDQTAVKTASTIAVSTLPAVGLAGGSRMAFAKGFVQSWLLTRTIFRTARPDAVLAMGGFTSAPPILVARGMKIPSFIHESNTIPGRANRWLSRFADCAFVGFKEAGETFSKCPSKLTGTPVRNSFRGVSASVARQSLGLAADRPVMLVTGGSQGAAGLNDLVITALPHLARSIPNLQVLHLSGVKDAEKMRNAYLANNLSAVVHPFFAEMPLALTAADVCVSRAGASSLAELAATRLPSILVPLPSSMDNHQYFNALAYQRSGAALLLEQKSSGGGELASAVGRLLSDAAQNSAMRLALAAWDFADAADQIAEHILQTVTEGGKKRQLDSGSEPISTRNRQTVAT
jgi:UDP-N-acetylglucosamine--N-acetylmuramyl-(pentapeptide) pyrophosphoryl-undecaprenol N-acetylglucosamine transferase